MVGKEAHAAKCATNGANAILESSYKIIEIEKFKNELGVTCNVGVIKGGSVANTVAGECSFEVDVRFNNKEEMQWIENQLKLIANKNYVKGCTTTLTKMSYRVAMEYSKKNEELLAKVNDILKKNGQETLSAVKSLAGSDAADVTAYGIPCLDSLGVEFEGIHTINEKAVLSSLKDSAKRLITIITNF